MDTMNVGGKPADEAVLEWRFQKAKEGSPFHWTRAGGTAYVHMPPFIHPVIVDLEDPTEDDAPF